MKSCPSIRFRQSLQAMIIISNNKSSLPSVYVIEDCDIKPESRSGERLGLRFVKCLHWVR